MVKHGLLIAREVKPGGRGQERCFKTNIHRNNGHEFDLPLLDSEEALVTFDLVTRDTYTPWGKPDEISFAALVVCKSCGQRARFVHGRTGFGKGMDLEEFRCLCGRCEVRLEFRFEANSTLDVLDWVPGLGAVIRVGAAVVSHAVDADEAAEDHWEKAASDLVPAALRKRRLLAKDGALTKVAELLPGSNIVAALLHASAGNIEEATRALDLLHNWQDIGSPDGALAKLAETFPGTDIVAFALQMRAGSFARALRAVTTEDRVTVRVASASVLFDVSQARPSTCLDIQVSGLQIGPTRRSVAGALVDFLEDLLGSEGGSVAPLPRRGSSLDSLPRTSPTAASPSAASGEASLGWLGRDQLHSIRGAACCKLDSLFTDAADAFERQLPGILQAVLSAVSAQLKSLRRRVPSTWSRFVPEEAPYPSKALAEQLLDCFSEAVREASAWHYEALPTVDPVMVRSYKGSDVRFVLLLLVAGLLVLLLRLGWLRSAALLCLHVAIAEAASWDDRLSRLSSRCAAALTVHNARTWSSTCFGTGSGAWRRHVASLSTAAARAAAPAPLVDHIGPRRGVVFGLGRGLPSPAWMGEPPGVIVELPPHTIAMLSCLLRRYLLEELLPLGIVFKFLEPILRGLARFLLLGVNSVPIVIPVAVSEQIIDERSVGQWPFKGKPLRIPSLRLALLLDISLNVRGPPVVRLRALLPETDLRALTAALAAQASDLDLRRLSRRLSDFPEEVKARFSLALRWPSPTRLSLEISGLGATLSLPA